jgi:flagellar motility protein MotE (MotC chaperone)
MRTSRSIALLAAGCLMAAAALAQENEKEEVKADAPAAVEAETEPAPAPCPSPSELAARALEIEAREAALREVERTVRAQIEELRTLRAQALAVLEPERQQREDELKKLVAFYQNMKPKSAADLIEKLPLDLATAVVSRMKTREAGKVLNVMGSERAVEISRQIAGPQP